MIESLEPRRLLSVTLNARGTLIITGTGGDDNFTLQVVDRQQVDPNGSIVTLPHVIVKRKGMTEGDVLMNKIHRIAVELRGGDDTLTGIAGSGKNMSIDAGAGDDLIMCGGGHDSVLAGNGNDTITGNNGNDLIDGGQGDDDMTGGDGDDSMISAEGADSMAGGDGSDTADCVDRVNALNITLDDTANDLESGQNGNVASDIETVIGGAGADFIDASFLLIDTLTGDAQDELLIGNGGKDTLIGGEGDDTLEGGTRNDSLSGGGGDDFLQGDNGRDRLNGDAGDDQFLTGYDSERDTLNGGEGENIGYFDFTDRVNDVGPGVPA